MRAALAGVVVTAFAAGCLPSGHRVGSAPLDARYYELRNRLMDAVPAAVEDALKGSAPAGATLERGYSQSGGGSGELTWLTNVRYVRPDGAAEPIAPARYETVMRSVEAALRTEFAAPDVSILDGTATRAARERPGAVGFMFRYSRAKGKVAGEVVGLIEPSKEFEGRTTVTVVRSEWCTE